MLFCTENVASRNATFLRAFFPASTRSAALRSASAPGSAASAAA